MPGSSMYKIFKEIMHFTICLIWASPSTRIPKPGVQKFTILVDPSLVNIYTLSLSVPCAASLEKKIF